MLERHRAARLVRLGGVLKFVVPRRAVASFVALSVLSASASPAFAQASSDASPQSSTGFAEALFDEGVKLMQEGKYPEACPKLAESQRLDPASGTLYNLSICLEKEGKIASAVMAFEESIARSVKDGNKEREGLARERLAQLKPRLSRVVVRIGPKVADLEGLDVRFDGASVRRQAWGIEVPMDPGVHALTVSAQGKREARREVDVNRPGQVFELSLDALEDAPAPPVTKSSPPSTASREAPESGARRWVGFGLLGLGGLFVVGGGVSGVLAIDRHSESDRLCQSPPGCSADGAAAEASANRFAWGANVGIGLGLVAAGIGTYLLLTAKPSPRPASTSVLGPRGVAFTF